QKWLSIALGGECRLWLRRCISPPVMTSIPAISCSSMAAWEARNWASAKSPGSELPAADEPIHCLVPARDTMSSHHSGGVFFVVRHLPPFLGSRNLSGSGPNLRQHSCSEKVPIQGCQVALP